MHFLLLSAAALLSACHIASAAFGPETATTMNTQFVTLYSSSNKLATLGVIASKRYFIVHPRLPSEPAAAYIAYYGDTTNGVNLGLKTKGISGPMPFGVLKFCSSTISGYNALPFADADQIDYSKNNSATIFYWRPSTNTFYSRTAVAPADTLCPQGPFASSSCLELDTGANSCLHMKDTVVTADDTTMYPWIIIDGKAAGFLDTSMCTTGTRLAPTYFDFYKMKVFKAELRAIANFEKN